MMHSKGKGLLSSRVLTGGLKNPNLGREVTSVVIHIYFLALHELFSLLAYLFFALALHLEKKNNKKFFITALHHCIIKA